MDTLPSVSTCARAVGLAKSGQGAEQKVNQKGYPICLAQDLKYYFRASTGFPMPASQFTIYGCVQARKFRPTIPQKKKKAAVDGIKAEPGEDGFKDLIQAARPYIPSNSLTCLRERL